MLTPEEEADLARKIKAGDQKALERLTQANLRFVVSVAKQYQNQGLSLSDLINEGNLGLMKAARRFDETKGFKFISYAVWWIRQSILSAIIEYSRIVRYPLNKVSSYSKANEARISFTQEYEREPTIDELADILGISHKDVANLLKSTDKHTSLDAPLSTDDEASTLLDIINLDDQIPPDKKLLEESLTKEIIDGMNVLSPREAAVLQAFFGLNDSKQLSLDEIADLYDLTRERVRQIKERAIRRLRKSYNRNGFRNFLED